MLYPVQTPQQLATHLRALRVAKGLSQAKLGERLQLSQARVARIENSPLNVSVKQLLQLLAALDAGMALETAATDKSNADTW